MAGGEAHEREVVGGLGLGELAGVLVGDEPGALGRGRAWPDVERGDHSRGRAEGDAVVGGATGEEDVGAGHARSVGRDERVDVGRDAVAAAREGQADGVGGALQPG